MLSGRNFIILNHTQQIAEVFAYDATLPSKKIPIVTRTMAYMCPTSGTTYILIVNEGLYYGMRLDHSLFNPNQIRIHGHLLWDNPFDQEQPIGIEADGIFIPFQTEGTKLLFKTQSPTSQELRNCPRTELIWEPRQVKLA
mmetsp:Transcript_36342/g.51394  ORF Transcript_36342/g.51394 Transcript_36342/m.51394 type:complete len:140 (+) Transcript_36342:582-1001(+)